MHLAHQPLHRALELPFQLSPVNHHDHGGVPEIVLAFQDDAGGGEQGKGFAGPLGVPGESSPLRRLRAALNDAVHGPALMLAEHGFLGSPSST